MKTKLSIGIMGFLLALSISACKPLAIETNPEHSATPVTITLIPGFTAPASGASPLAAITETAQYSGTVSWSPAVSGTFSPATVYTATITLTAKPGFTLIGVPANSFSVAGATSVTHGADSGIVTAVFPATDAYPVSLFSITGLVAPVLGVSPVTTITETSQYTGTVSWSPAVSATFSPATVYTATITLTAKPGFSLTGLPANSFSVAGATSVTHGADSAIVTAAFPATDAYPVSLFSITGLVAPVVGVSPVTTITETSQYTGTVSWSPTVSASFKPLTVYTATITMVPKTGFTLTGVPSNTFTVAGATSVTHGTNSGVVTATFPATPETTVYQLEIPGVAAPVVGGMPASSIGENEQYTGTVTWDGSWEWSNRFGGQKVYTATIRLTPKYGYNLTGLAANSFMLPGASSVTHGARSGVITVRYPATAGVSVGAEMLGGVVVYILGASDIGYVPGEQRGIIAPINNQNSYAYWCKPDYARTAVPGADRTAIGTGKANTDLICAMNGPGTDYAAGIARAYTGGGYNDWYLPSRDELGLLVDMRDYIALLSACFFSSSESAFNYAYIVWNDRYFDTGLKCSGSRAVRAVRNF